LSEFPLRDYLIGKLLEADALDSEAAMSMVHKRYNTALGFPVTACTQRRNSLTDCFKPWQKNAKMTNIDSDVTCKNCMRVMS
jgi:hypothetical protein